jgi:hypothetical protein
MTAGEVRIIAPSTRESVHTRALRTLVDGRVGVLTVRPGLVEARVRCLSGHVHRVDWRADRGWSCDCEASPSTRCYHQVAVARVVVLPDDDPQHSWTTMR